MIEAWKQIEGWPHEVSSLGRVRNTNTGNVLKAIPHKSGYMNVQLWNSGMYKTFMIHRLVAIAFIGEQPSAKHEVAHGDGDRHNNTVANLRWVLHAENMRDRDRHGTTARGERNGKIKHQDETVIKVKELHASGLGSRKIAKVMGLSRSTVYGYIKRTRRQTTSIGGPSE